MYPAVYPKNRIDNVDVWFWPRVDMSAGADACWPWIGHVVSGYGSARLNGKTKGAHVIAYTATHGPVPSGLVVMHACDNPPCCNPAHLSAGTYRDNTQDSIRKGRKPSIETHSLKTLTRDQTLAIRALYATGDYSHETLAAMYRVNDIVIRARLRGMKVLHVRGEDASHAKLTEAQVIEIRARRARREKLRSIAALFGITIASVCDIDKRRTWRHLP